MRDAGVTEYDGRREVIETGTGFWPGVAINSKVSERGSILKVYMPSNKYHR